VRYARLLEGLEISIIPFGGLNLGDRADAEYFSKENRAIEKSLKDHDALPLREFGTLVGSAFYPAATDLYETGDVPFARCVDCIEHPVITRQQDAEFVRVPSWFVEQSKQIDCAGRGDIIITKVGTPCFASVVHDYDRLALSRTVLGLVRVHDIDPYYLTAFFRCRFGFNQLFRQREQTIQFQLTLERVRKVLVYIASPELQAVVKSAMLEHVAALERAQSTYERTEATLRDSLGIGDWHPPDPQTYTLRLSRVFHEGRLDAEFHRPKVDALRHALATSFHLKHLGDLGVVENGQPVSYDEKGDVPIIRSGDLSNIEDDSRFLRARSTIPIYKLERGDVLVSSIGFGSIGKIQVFDKTGVYGTVSEVTVIRQNELNPYFVASFLRSQLGQMQIDRYITGATGQLHLYKRDVRKFFLPIIPDSEQKRFEVLAREAAAARAQARASLDKAKRGVEIAIEESESAALKYLKES
jgi:hypothetical protein